MSVAERAVFAGTFLLLATAAWIGSCALRPPERILGWMGGGLFVLLALVRGGRTPQGFRERVAEWMLDPVALVWFLFLLLLTVQWQNGGRAAVYARQTGGWTFGPPPVPWLPSSINRAEAAGMLHWFIPAGAVMLAIRKRFSADACRLLMRLLSVNAALLSAFGIVQLLTGARLAIASRRVGAATHTFATFAYSNHAGAYFVLLFGVAAAAFLRDLFEKRGRSTGWRTTTGGAALLCLVGASLSLSQMALLLVWFLAALVAALVAVYGWLRWGPVTRLNAVLGMAAIAGLAALFVSGAARTHATAALGTVGHIQLERAVEGRQFLADAAIELWKQAPWFGTGGWGFRHFLPVLAGKGQWPRIHAGYANVHCDLFQFLGEFGVAGVGLLSIAAAGLLVPVMAVGSWRRPVSLVLLAGLTAVVVHSLVDLPFRNPAILCTWWGTLALVSNMGRGAMSPRRRLPRSAGDGCTGGHYDPRV